MRKITREICAAFYAGKPVNKANSAVTVSPEGWVIMLLHGNAIARYKLGATSSETLEVSNGGWSSNTTKERLNGIYGVSVHQKNWVWYLNGKEWDGSWRKVAV